VKDFRGEPQGKDIDAQLHGGRDLVDILPARPRRRDETSLASASARSTRASAALTVRS
jgi:hypothetical protein